MALYRFDEGKGDMLKDSSGHDHHGKIVGATWVNPDGSPVRPAEPAWVSLLDGKDSDNWDGDTKLLRWNKDTLFLSATNAMVPHSSNIVLRKPVKDFELEFDIKLGKQSGFLRLPVWVQFRGARQAPGEVLAGYLVDIRPNHCNELHHGSVASFKKLDITPPKVMIFRKKDDFNHVRVRCEGKRLTVQLNGLATIDETVPDMPDAGLLSFHWPSGTEVLLQNVRLKELAAGRPAPK